MKIIKEWFHEGLGKIICAEQRAYQVIADFIFLEEKKK